MELDDAVPDTPPPIKTPKVFLPLYADDSEPTASCGKYGVSFFTISFTYCFYPQDMELDDAVPDTPPPIKTPKVFLPLYADDADDSDDELTSTSLSLYVDKPPTTTVIDKTNSDDEYVISDIEITDELIALLDKTNSDDEYNFSDIEMTDEVIALLDKTNSDDEYDFSDIELNDALIAELDKIR
jgi:hypothetical protein